MIFSCNYFDVVPGWEGFGGGLLVLRYITASCIFIRLSFIAVCKRKVGMRSMLLRSATSINALIHIILGGIFVGTSYSRNLLP